MWSPATVTVVTALWVSLGQSVFDGSWSRSGSRFGSGSEGPGCDNGKFSLNRDLMVDAVSWDCSSSTWSETEKHLSVDTVYVPEPVTLVCMDTLISYNHRVPNSGAYRPVRAESGEYLYCPPQRWLNNLHRGAAVLLYHPCAPLRQRLLLSTLARSCLSDYIVTAHPQLNKHMPIALVSWGRTLELSTVDSSVCDWLETAATGGKFSDVEPIRKYDLLLTRSAKQHPQERSTMEESVRSCCEQTISSLKNQTKEAEQEEKIRQRRAAVRDQQRDVDDKNITVSGQNPNPKTRHLNQSSTSRPQTPTTRSNPSDRGGLELQENKLLIQTETQLSSKHAAPKNTNLSADAHDSVKQKKDSETQIKTENGSEDYDEDNRADGAMKEDEVIDVKERELERKKTHDVSRSHLKSENNDFDSVSKSSQQQRSDQQDVVYLPNDCDGCTKASGAEASGAEASGAEARAAVAGNGLPRTPRTDEAVWAAAALGFLLVLLTLSVLHTRLYRHWRTTPSLYWHDPRQDYDSVADVIRRRLRIAKRRRKRGRRQECVLLPSSSSSDELL